MKEMFSGVTLVPKNWHCFKRIKKRGSFDVQSSENTDIVCSNFDFGI